MIQPIQGVGKLEDQTAIGHQDVINGILDQFVGLSSKVIYPIK